MRVQAMLPCRQLGQSRYRRLQMSRIAGKITGGRFKLSSIFLPLC